MNELPVIWPMNAVNNPKKTEALMANDRYIAQIKLDGVRGLIHITKDGCRVTSRGESKHDKGKPIEKTAVLPHIAEINIPELYGTVLDCELLDPMQRSEVIAGAVNSKEVINTNIKAFVFDILVYKGQSLMDQSLEYRLRTLDKAMEEARTDLFIQLPYFIGKEDKEKMLQDIIEMGGEGIVLKNLDAVYQPGKRYENNWYKIKKHDTWDVVVIGYTEPEMHYTGKEIDSWLYWYDPVSVTRSTSNKYLHGLIPVTKFWYYNWIGAIRFGMYHNGELIELGQTSGMSEHIRNQVSSHGEEYLNTVMEIEAMEQLPSGAFRHPRFIRFRDDKRPEECIWEG